MGCSGEASRKREVAKAEAEVADERAKAFEILKKLAEGGDAASQFSLAERYFKGRKTIKDSADIAAWDDLGPEDLETIEEPNVTEAAKWFRKAADQGHSQAQYQLACMLATGNGMQQDNESALTLIRDVAEQGDTAAAIALGYLLLHGDANAKDAVEGHAWWVIAYKLLSSGGGESSGYLEQDSRAKRVLKTEPTSDYGRFHSSLELAFDVKSCTPEEFAMAIERSVELANRFTWGAKLDHEYLRALREEAESGVNES